VLLILADAPMHGYQIMQELAERSGGTWRPSPGAIYPALQRLEDAGLIVGEDTSDDRRIYRLTEEGQRIADRLKAHDVTPWEADAAGTARFELKRDLGQLAQAVMQVARDGSPQQREKAQALLASTRRALYRILGEEEAETAAESPTSEG
jgi:DNA-binding PadR family transcriptional regulator